MAGRSRADETPQGRQARLAAQRRYARHRRSALRQIETEEQTTRRLEQQRLASRQRRERESNAQRQQRLSRQREYDRGRRQQLTSGSDQTTNYDAGDSAYEMYTRDGNLKAITLEDAERIEEQLRLSIGPYGLDECVCAVCDRLVLSKSSRGIPVTDTAFLGRMRDVLMAPCDPPLPQLLAAHYCCTDIDEALHGMLLSREGIYTSNGTVDVLICQECFQHLRTHSDSPPKHAIANGFYVGVLPDQFADLSWIEKVMVQLVTNVAQTRVMRGGQHRAIRSHCIVYDAIPGPPATLLPQRVDANDTYRVVLAGPRTQEQDSTIRKLHEARGGVVNALLAFLKANNHFYADVAINEAPSTAVAFELISVEEDDLDVASQIDIEQASVVGHGDESANSGDEECRVIERSVLLVPQDIVPDSAFAQRVIDTNATETNQVPRLRVQHSSVFSQGSDVEPRMFAHLFPFGRGHPAEKRRTAVSKSECIRHYLLLSRRAFARDPTFLLTAFSRLALEHMFTLTSIKCTRYPTLVEGFDAITKEDLAQALLNRERRHRGQSSVPLENPTAERFLRSVELGSVSVWGSNAERRHCRKQAFAYQTLYGQPSLFVTITPNSEGSFAMAHYAGILNVQSFFDYLEANVPSKAELRKAAMADDASSARLFMRLVDAFIADVLGMDPVTKTTSQEGGLFGVTRAYFGMVETQGRGTLHIHFLIWIAGLPKNAHEYKTRLEADGSTFIETLVAFANSTVTTKMPLCVGSSMCPRCSIPWELDPRPITAEMRKNPTRHTTTRFEPVLRFVCRCGFPNCVHKHVSHHASSSSSSE